MRPGNIIIRLQSSESMSGFTDACSVERYYQNDCYSIRDTNKISRALLTYFVEQVLDRVQVAESEQSHRDSYIITKQMYSGSLLSNYVLSTTFVQEMDG